MAIKFEKIPVTSSDQIFTIKKTDGSTIQTDLAGLLNERKLGTIDDIPVPPTTPPPAADPCAPLAPLGCTDLEQQAQNQSLVLILNDMASLDVSTLQYPVQIHLVRLCDGSTAYILDQFLGDLEGSHLTIGSLTVTSPDQLFNVTAVQPEPIFAMAFNHEANGNISRAEWQVTYNQPQYYDYGYDQLNRLTSAQYGRVVPLYSITGVFMNFSHIINNNYSVPTISYDGDGNIETLQRFGMIPDGNCFTKNQIDNLAYEYFTDSPRLKKVTDTAPSTYRPKGFNPGTASTSDEYEYDANGNLETDPYKSLHIDYNLLNLPSSVIKGGASMTIRYDVTGRKWSQTGTEGIREYVGGVEYLDGEIQSVQHSEGRLVATYNETAIESIRAEYWRQDHLGNTRVAFSDFNLDGVIATKDDPNTTENEVEITQENHYYPFGLNHDGPWYQLVQPKNHYQYNGKEYVEDLGLNWLDYGARWYDPSIGRWNAIDPLSEEYYIISPFAYVTNNPLKYIDPDGKYIDIEYQDESGEIQKYRYGSGDRTKNKFVKQVVKTLDKLVKKGADVEGVINTLKEDDSNVTINETRWDGHNATVSAGPGGGNISWSPEGGIVTDEGKNRSPSLGLLHELGHAFYGAYKKDQEVDEPKVEDFNSIEEFNNAYDAYERSFGAFDNSEDKWVIERVENPAAIILGQPTRKAHSYKRKFRANGPFSVKEKKN